MSLGAFLVTTFLETFAAEPRMLACTFPAPNPSAQPISVAVEARPSLLDRVDQFRVFLHLGDGGELGALVQPIERTDDRDVLIRGRGADATFYTIGLRDDGRAKLNLLRLGAAADGRETETRAGACRDYKAALDLWLRS